MSAAAILDSDNPTPAYAKRPGHLFGDFDYLIDKFLDSDPSIKTAVTKADWDGRGFASLDYFLSRLPSKDYQNDYVYTVCKQDGPNPTVKYLKALKDDLAAHPIPKGICKHRKLFRVDVTRSGKRYRQSFKTLEDAQSYLQQLSGTLEGAKSSQNSKAIAI